MATENFDSEIDDIGISAIEGMLDNNGVFRLQTPSISSYNFDGLIGTEQLNIAASAVQPGMQISLTGSAVGEPYYTVLLVDNSDENLSASPSQIITIQYADEDSFQQVLSIGASAIISIQRENWEDKYLGENGWYIGTSGNAIFSNVAIRGEIEATTMDIGGAEGIIYDGNTVTIGASVVINAALTVGASGNFIVSGSAAQDIISNNTTITGGNIATGNIKSTGYSGPGTGSAFSTTGMSINLDDGSIVAPNFKIDNGGNAHFKGVVQSASGAIGGFAVSASQISIAGFTMSTASGIFLGDNREFSVDTSGNLVATSASIIGNIIATSGSFTGALNAATGTFAGNLSAAGGTFSGTLSANSITSGTINASVIGVTNLSATNITTGTLSGRLLQTSGYSGVTDGSAFSSAGAMAINLSNGTITAPKFRIDTSGNAFFDGTISANNVTSGILTGSTFRSSAAINSTSGDGVYLDSSGNVRFSNSNAAITFNSSGLSISGANVDLVGYATDGELSSGLTNLNIVTKWNGGQVTGLTLSSAGSIATLGKSYASGTGWILEYNGGVPRFDIGNYSGGTTQYLRWTGSQLELFARNNSAGLPYVSLTGGTNPTISFGDEGRYVQMNSAGTLWSGQSGPFGPSQTAGRFSITQVQGSGFNSLDMSLFAVNSTTSVISRLSFKDTPISSTVSNGLLEITGPIRGSTGTLTVNDNLRVLNELRGINNVEFRQIVVDTALPSSPGSYTNNTLWVVV